MAALPVADARGRYCRATAACLPAGWWRCATRPPHTPACWASCSHTWWPPWRSRQSTLRWVGLLGTPAAAAAALQGRSGGGAAASRQACACGTTAGMGPPPSSTRHPPTGGDAYSAVLRAAGARRIPGATRRRPGSHPVRLHRAGQGPRHVGPHACHGCRGAGGEGRAGGGDRGKLWVALRGGGTRRQGRAGLTIRAAAGCSPDPTPLPRLPRSASPARAHSCWRPRCSACWLTCWRGASRGWWWRPRYACTPVCCCTTPPPFWRCSRAPRRRACRRRPTSAAAVQPQTPRPACCWRSWTCGWTSLTRLGSPPRAS